MLRKCHSGQSASNLKSTTASSLTGPMVCLLAAAHFPRQARTNPRPVMEKCKCSCHQPRQLPPFATHPAALGPTLQSAPLPVYSASRHCHPVPPFSHENQPLDQRNSCRILTHQPNHNAAFIAAHQRSVPGATRY